MKTFLKVDHWGQWLLFLLMILTSPSIFVPMLLLGFLGMWQLLSATVAAIFYKKLARKYYLTTSLCYLLLMTIGSISGVVDRFPNFAEGFILFLFWLIIPLGIGIWYYTIVKRDYHKYCGKPVVKSNTMELNSPYEKKELILS